MSIADLIREQAFALRDSVHRLDEDIVEEEGRQAASEEQLRRCGTEITRQRTLERDLQQSLSDAERKISEAQQTLDDLGQKRQEALETLTRCQEEQRTAARSCQDAQEARRNAEHEIQVAQQRKRDCDRICTRLREELSQKQTDLHRQLLEILRSHLNQQAEHLRSAFASQDQQAHIARQREEFKKARHSDPAVSNLCEQKEEFEKLLINAVIPDIRRLLEQALEDVRRQLVRRFPCSLQTAHSANPSEHIDDLLFYTDGGGRVVFLLPISEIDWNDTECGRGGNGTLAATCLIWNMIRELPLKRGDGNFVIDLGRPVFRSAYEIEDMAGLEGFAVKHDGVEVFRYHLSEVPPEIQEALANEDQYV